jgi:MinD-like ATPase involved in chromosome partitioning or flagellar assembly
MSMSATAYHLGVGGIIGTAGAAVINPDAIRSLGSLPIGVAALLLAAYAVHTAYRQAVRSSEAQENSAQAVRELAEKLSERPCIRHRAND